MELRFTKMHGAGNDFLLIDDRTGIFPLESTEMIARIASRRVGVGCEGLLILRTAEVGSGVDYRMIFLNPDGSRAAMCGNASRCVAWFAYSLGIAGKRQCFLSDAGILVAEILALQPGGGEVEVHVTDPYGRRPKVAVQDARGTECEVFFVNTGVPHAVIWVEDLVTVDVEREGRAVRWASAFSPDGTNVDFVSWEGEHRLKLRTYERGVEAESGACGTGALAAAVAAVEQGRGAFPISIEVQSGDILVVDGVCGDEGLCQALTLTGPVRCVYEGMLDTTWFEGAQ